MQGLTFNVPYSQSCETLELLTRGCGNGITVRAFEAKLDNFWKDQPVKFNFDLDWSLDSGQRYPASNGCFTYLSNVLFTNFDKVKDVCYRLLFFL